MKKLFYTLLLSASIITYTESVAMPMPSVADVFSGMSQDQITEQVKMGQMFLEDLEKNGTPEEKAQFEQLLLETLNSMSEQDFKDITDIAQMVEPYLDIPQEPIAIPTPTATKVEPKDVIKVAESEADKIKNLINTIIQRIDDILQKLNSSKECQEEIDLKWSNKATFSNLKRLIQSLKNNRLIEKLAKKDISDDDKKLLELLEKFSKDLTEQNNKLVIEDDFGLPSDRKTEQKHLKQTQVILEIFDQYIDSMLPILEKFFTKWDPEALQIAKELEAKTVKAQKDTKEAQARRPSMDARPTQPTPYTTNQPSSSSGYNQAGYYPNDYGAYDQYYPQENNQFDNFGNDNKGTSGGSAAPSGKPVEAKAPTTPEAPKVDAKKAAAKETFEGVVESLEDHLDIFGEEYTEKVNEFFDNPPYPDALKDPIIVAQGIDLSAPVTNASIQPLDPVLFSQTWLANQCQPAMTKMFEIAKKTLKKEITSAHSIIADTKNSLKSMDLETLKKLSNNSALNAIETRFNNYNDKYDDLIKNIDKLYATNKKCLSTDQTIQAAYENMHTNFIRDLREILAEPLGEIKNEFSVIKHKIRREIRNKSK